MPEYIIVYPLDVVEDPDEYIRNIKNKKLNDEKAQKICNNIMLCIGWTIVCCLLIYLIILIIIIPSLLNNH